MRPGATGCAHASDVHPHPGVVLSKGHRALSPWLPPLPLPPPCGPSDSSDYTRTELLGPKKAPLAGEGSARPHCRAEPGRAACEQQDSGVQGQRASHISRGPTDLSALHCSNFPRTPLWHDLQSS